jgi:hypothetical protein
MKKIFLIIISIAFLFSFGWVGSGCGGEASARTESDRITEALARRDEGGFNYREMTSMNIVVESNKEAPKTLTVEYRLDNAPRDGSVMLHVTKFEGEQNLVGMMPPMPGAQDADPGAEMAAMLKTLNARFLKDTLYAQLSGTWYKMNKDDFTANAPEAEGLDWETFSCLIKGQLTNPVANFMPMNSDLWKNLSLQNVEKLGSEDIGGVASDHYRFSYNSDIDATELMSAISVLPAEIAECDLGSQMQPPESSDVPPEVAANGLPPEIAERLPPEVAKPGLPPEIFANGMPPDFTGMPPAFAEQMAQTYRSMVEGITTEVWIDAEDNVRRISVVQQGNKTSMFMMLMAGPHMSSTSTMTVTQTFSDLNQELEIASPENGQPMQSLGEFLSTMESRQGEAGYSGMLPPAIR